MKTNTLKRFLYTQNGHVFYGRTFASSHPARWGISKTRSHGKRKTCYQSNLVRSFVTLEVSLAGEPLDTDLEQCGTICTTCFQYRTRMESIFFRSTWLPPSSAMQDDTPYLISIYSWCSFLRLVDVSILSNPKVGTGTGHVPWSQFCILALACSPALWYHFSMWTLTFACSNVPSHAWDHTWTVYASLGRTHPGIGMSFYLTKWAKVSGGLPKLRDKGATIGSWLIWPGNHPFPIWSLKYSAVKNDRYCIWIRTQRFGVCNFILTWKKIMPQCQLW